MAEELKTPYKHLIEEENAKKEETNIKLKESLDKMQQHTATAAQIGHDGRVDEAIMLTFLQSLLDSAINSVQAGKALKQQLAVKMIEKKIKELEDAENNTVKTANLAKMINKYEVLVMKKSYLEKELNSDGSKDEKLDNMQRRTKESQLKNINEDLTDLTKEMKLNMSEKEFENSLFESQTRYFGEKAAQAMKNMRHQTHDAPEILNNSGINSIKEMNDIVFATSRAGAIANNTKEMYEKANEAAGQTEKTAQTEKMA